MCHGNNCRLDSNSITTLYTNVLQDINQTKIGRIQVCGFI